MRTREVLTDEEVRALRRALAEEVLLEWSDSIWQRFIKPLVVQTSNKAVIGCEARAAYKRGA